MKLPSILPAATLALLLTACGPQASAPTSTTATNAGSGSSPGPDGQAIYSRSCALCHATGTAGAPRLGDKADWEPRLAQGMDVIHRHAIEGFTGRKGIMPARGGAASLTDDEVKAAADFMAGNTDQD
jgi:cytochrome c5